LQLKELRFVPQGGFDVQIRPANSSGVNAKRAAQIFAHRDRHMELVNL
jgi:hypothetical protein